MLRSSILAVLLACAATLAWAQAAPDAVKAALLADINREVWAPYLDGINQDRPELYSGVNSPDFHWVAAGKRTRIMNAAEYDADSRAVMAGRAGGKARARMDVRFTERNLNADFASERCIFRYVVTEEGKPDVATYGEAHVFSRRENGAWKKLVQYVMGPATHAAWAQAQAM